MPWRRPNNAAIGLASLKAVAIQAGAAACDVYYLNDRWFHLLYSSKTLPEKLRATRFAEFSRIYSELAGVIHSGEWFFARDIFGDAVPDLKTYANYFAQAADKSPFAEFTKDFIQSSILVGDFLSECESASDWEAYDVIGFSCVFYQLASSLALARRIKSHGFKGKIVFGGPLCEGAVGQQLLRSFSFIDAVFDGESEQSFAEFVKRNGRQSLTDPIKGLWYRDSGGAITKWPGQSGIENLDAIPLPDYSDFFGLPGITELIEAGDISFPIEGSRGCWWGMHHHCVFCGLNGADMRYRTKSPNRITEELRLLHNKHKIRHFAFTDNIVSAKVMKPLFRELNEHPLPITFHAETKSNLNRQQVSNYRRAGFTYLQPGIESLSSDVLRIIDKGVSGLHNIACLKYCREMGIHSFWNLLYGFPGESAADFEHTMRILPAIVHLAPPEVVTPMRLTRFSPSFDRSEELGFHRKRPARFFSFIFPFDQAVQSQLVNTFDFDFADSLDRESLIEPITKFVERWQNEQNPGFLVYDPDGGGLSRPALIDTRFSRVTNYYELSPLEDFIFRQCDAPTHIETITEALRQSHEWGETTREDLAQVLDRLKHHLFVVQEGNQVVNTALSDSTFIPWQALAAVDFLHDEPTQAECL